MNIVNGFDIDTPDGAKAYLESEGINTEQCVKDGLEVIAKIKALCLAPVVRSYFKNCGGCGQITTSDRWIVKTERNIKDHYRPICKKCAIWAELPVY